MGKTMKATKFAGKLALFAIGTVPGSVRLVEETTRKIAPNFSGSIDDSTLGSLALGDSDAHSFVINELKSAFDAKGAELTADETSVLEARAKELAETSGAPWEVLFSGLKASALDAKNSTEK